jgi:hypothetical protein
VRWICLDSAAVRFEKILKLIRACDLSVHDISRVQLDSSSGLPRFNMPLELGADLALRLEGSATDRKRRVLVMDAELHRYDQTLSDISGMDIEVHNDKVEKIIRVIRDWLNGGRGKGPPLPGSAAIDDDYKAFLALAPDLLSERRLDNFEALPHTDYLWTVREALPRIEAARS